MIYAVIQGNYSIYIRNLYECIVNVAMWLFFAITAGRQNILETEKLAKKFVARIIPSAGETGK